MSKETPAQKAQQILYKHRRKIDDFEVCCKAAICPTCGAPLEVFGESDDWVVCPDLHDLIHPDGTNVKHIKYEVWEKTINDKIRNLHTEYWDDDW
jgi:hypothetical protein